MAFRSTTDAIGKLGAVNDTGVALANVAGEQSYRTVMWGIWLMMAAALAMGAAVGWLLTRSLTVPLSFAASTADRIADGDLTGGLRSTHGDELGDLLRALARRQGALNSSVSDVRRSADSISIASQEVSSGGHDLSVRTEAAAASIEQTSAALVVGSVQRVSSLIGEIASAIEEQSQRVGEVITAISHLYGMTQLTPRLWSSPPRRWRAFGSRARDQRSG
ncbi:methyl-accepting chemotaxis protein [Acidovorax sp. LjRoot118]|uniref:hypothetical protein n=1 Tax=Acidovorax sp. LjRoot118 TaxID=3342256 RepID=UPI003ECD011F